MELSRNYLYAIVAISIFTAGLLAWYFFLKPNPFSAVAGTYCSYEPGSSLCYELKDDGTFIMRVRKEGTVDEYSFESIYTVEGNKLNIDSPNLQVGRKTVFTVEEGKLCADGDCRFTRT